MEFYQIKKTKKIKQSYIKVAMEEALKSRLTSKHGAIIINQGKIIGKGHNRYSYTPHRGFAGRLSLHAEIDALNNVGRRQKLNGAIMYVIRLGFDLDNGKIELRYSAPCRECSKKIRKCMQKYGLACVYFSSDSKIL